MAATLSASASIGGLRDDLALGRRRPGRPQRGERGGEVALGAVAAVLADRLDVDLAHRHGGGGHHLAGGERAHRRLDPRRGVLHRQQHVVGDGLVESLVQGPHLLRVRVRQRLLDEQDDVVVLSS